MSASFLNATAPADIAALVADRRAGKAAFRNAGCPQRLLSGLETRALKSGCRQTGQFQSNRDARWTLQQQDPQYGTEQNCKIIQLRLLAMLLQFKNPPQIQAPIREMLEVKYLGEEIIAGSYRDSLLLESLDYAEFVIEAQAPRHGASNFHIGMK